MRVGDMIEMFADFYDDFDVAKADEMCHALGLKPQMKIKTLSKGTKEKMQLMLVMSRKAKLYLLDEPIAGVDPAAREFIMRTILTNYSEDATVLISTHLILDVEKVLDEAVFLREGRIVGRIGAILSRRANEKWNEKRMRFSCVDFIDDEEVSRALFDAAEAFAREKEERYRDFCLSHPERLHLTDGAVEMLDYLKENGIPFALATGSEWDNMVFYYRYLELGRWFSESNTVYVNGTFPGKPAPDMYQIAARKIGLSPKDCLVFEDGTSGILAANRAEAGAVIAMYEKGLPSPVTEQVSVCEEKHDFTDWQNTLAKYGLLR
jgi:HAD superfamily hydrolase (TIGR01509 family)